ncbi:MAG: hypothetical protein HC893_04180 [Chloroflexaceae bacterium]|nr:hypothetical protein [Chloroflexaceae bacterium]
MSRDVSLPSQWQTLLASLRAELSYDKLIPTLVGAFSAVIGLSSLYLSFAALIFSGELAPYVPIGFSLFVVGGIITLALVALGSSLPGVIAAPNRLP